MNQLKQTSTLQQVQQIQLIRLMALNTSFTMTTTDSGIDGAYTINPTTPSVTEGATDNMTFVLNYPPTDTVTITLTSGGTDEAGISTYNTDLHTKLEYTSNSDCNRC